MRFPFLASFIVFIIWLTYKISKSRRASEKIEKSYWERERAANNTRRKSLDGLAYIHIPLEKLPMAVCSTHSGIAECQNTIRTLSTQTIVNFTGYSNTDLKLMYGAPNITLLTEYDQNYTLLARTLQKWGELLYEQGFVQEAKTVLEFAISTETDVSSTYKLLASIYQDLGESKKTASLMETAQKLRSLSKNTIVRILQESDPSND